jgi:hypothetical protein
LNVGGEFFAYLNHNAMMWYVARAAIEQGISPAALSRHHVGHESTRWLSLDGDYDLASFCAEAQRQSNRRESLTKRFQLKQDDDLFCSHGRTWALTTQWGEGTGEAATSFGHAFSQLELSLSGGTDETQPTSGSRAPRITQPRAPSAQGVVRRRPTTPLAELLEGAEQLERERLELESERKRLEQERRALDAEKLRLQLPSDDELVRDATALSSQEALPRWLLAIPEPARRVFHHIAEHGAVNEEEATRLLGGARYFRQFSLEFETYRCPFRVRIEMSGGIKCYVRDERGTE